MNDYELDKDLEQSIENTLNSPATESELYEEIQALKETIIQWGNDPFVSIYKQLLIYRELDFKSKTGLDVNQWISVKH